jgi:L-lysine 2,3-aminomutase
MITQIEPAHPPSTAWQQELQRAFTRPQALVEFLGLDPEQPRLAQALLRQFPLRVPRGYAARMRHGDPDDPLLRQVWPAALEAENTPGYAADAVGELAYTLPGGVIHKYRGRVLLIATGACAVHCRYCFRRHFPYSDALATRDHWRQALEAIASDRSIEEVILSGGDPLSLTDDRLAELAEALEFIPHVHRLRVHTRQPIVLPERVDDRLLSWLSRGRVRKIMVLHANHPHEIDAHVAAAAARLRAAQIPLLNQSVLLAGVNDHRDTLAALSTRLFEIGVLPYYLHLLDRVHGAAHFDVPTTRAIELIKELQHTLPGYLVPRLVREESGQPAKTVVAW